MEPPFDLTIEHIRAAMRRPLPGRAAHLAMAARPRPLDPPAGVVPRQAATLLLLYPREGRLHLVFTVRPATLGHHGGQVSFPGGGWEEGDGSLLATALREAAEELGMAGDGLEVLGPLTPLYVPPSNNCIHPFVAYTPERPAFAPDPREVAALLEVPLRHFLDPRARRTEERESQGPSLHVPFYSVGEHKVWGATAMILAEFTAAIAAT